MLVNIALLLFTVGLSGIYAIYLILGAFLVALILFLRSMYYYTMKVSEIDGPM